MSCKLCEQLTDSSDSTRYIWHDNFVTAFLYKDQYFLGRVIVISNLHATNVLDMGEESSLSCFSSMLRVARAVRKAYQPDLLNYALLGNVERHVHWHIIPRRKHDTLWVGPPWPHPIRFLDESAYEIEAKKVTGSILGGA